MPRLTWKSTILNGLHGLGDLFVWEKAAAREYLYVRNVTEDHCSSALLASRDYEHRATLCYLGLDAHEQNCTVRTENGKTH